MDINLTNEEIIQLTSILTNICIGYSKEADDVLNYYFLSKNAIKQDFAKKKEAIPENFAIMNLFDSVHKAKTVEDKTKRIAEILKEKINDKYCLSDFASELTYDESKKALVYNTNRKLKKYRPDKARSLLRELSHMTVASKTSILSAAIITFEKFLSNLYRNLIACNPCLYFESKTVCIQELLTKDLQTVIDGKIDELIESDMYDSLSLLKKIFEREKINTADVNDVLSAFEESYYRRNIYVHNHGEANHAYLSKIKDYDGKIKVGDYLSCNDEYITNLTDNVKSLIFFITFSVLLKIGYNEEYTDELTDYYYTELKDKKYKFAKYVYMLLSKNKKCPLAFRMSYEVNYLICLKRLGDKEFEKELKSFDVSASDNKFKVAKAVLEEKFEEASLMIADYYNPKETPEELIDWPLFEDFRKTDFYKSIVEKHQDDFDSFKEVDIKS